MRKHPREVHQFVEDIQKLPALGAQASRHFAAVGSCAFDQQFSGYDRLDDPHAMLLEQPANLVANGRQRTVLNFDQLIPGDGINAIAVEPHFGARRRPA